MGMFAEALKEAAETGGQSLKLVNGENAVRVLTEPAVMASPKPAPLTAEEQKQLDAMKPIKEVVSALLAAQGEENQNPQCSRQPKHWLRGVQNIVIDTLRKQF